MLYTNFTLFKGLGEMKLNTRERERGREGGREGERERERERERLAPRITTGIHPSRCNMTPLT